MNLSRKDLYGHRMLQHGAGDTSALWEKPFETGPWIKEDGSEDKAFKDVYLINTPHILSKHTFKNINTKYNFPTNNLNLGINEFEKSLKEIYDNQKSAFKFNLSLGYILKNRETGEYQYFIPYTNNELLKSPRLINSLSAEVAILRRAVYL
jgi:hypothetical protein